MTLLDALGCTSRLLLFARSKLGAANNLPPLPVLRERAGVRVISSTSDTGIPNHPHPNPLPEYRERGRRRRGHQPREED